MQIAACFRRVCCPLLVLFAIAVLTSACHAVSMDVTIGFNGVHKEGFWTPLAVKLTNPGEDNIEGVLVVNQTDNDAPPLPVCTTQVKLPGHSTKIYHVYVRLPSYSDTIRVSLARGRGVLAFKHIDPQPAAGNDQVVVTIGNRASRLSFLQGDSLNPQRTASGSAPTPTPSPQITIHAGSLLPTELPDRPAGFEQADVIIAPGLSPDTVSPAALKALSVWVATGNTLVVPTGADYKACMNEFYDEMLPVTIQGADSMPGMLSLASFGKKAFPTGPAAVTKSVLKPGIGAILLSESGTPLIVERRYGTGRVIFLAFDINAAPFKDWDGQTEFWKSIIKRGPADCVTETSLAFADDIGSGYYGHQPQDLNSLASVVTRNPSIKTPSISVIGLFLLAYLVVLVPVNYLFLRKRRRLELAWISTPLIVVVFALGAYAIGYTMKGGELRLCECRVIEGSSGARFARAVSNAFVFSPARRSYDIAVADPTAMSQVIPLSREDAPVDAFLGETTLMEGISIPMWSSKTFEAVGGEDLGGVIDSNLKLVGKDIVGTIRNNTNVDLRDCVVRFGKSKSDSFALGRGQARNIRMPFLTSGPMPHPGYYDADTDVRLRLLRWGDFKASTSGLTLVGFATPRQGVFRMPNDRPTSERAACYLFHLD